MVGTLVRIEKGRLDMNVGQACVGPGEAGLQLDRPREHALRLGKARLGEPPQMVEPALVEVPGGEVLGSLARRDLALDARELGLDHGGDLLRHDLLDVEDVRQGEIVDLGPELALVGRAVELDRDAHTLARGPDAAAHDVADPQPGRDLAWIHRAAAVLGGRMPRQHRQPAVASEKPDHVLRQPIAEVVVVGILVDVREWKHGDRRPAGIAPVPRFARTRHRNVRCRTDRRLQNRLSLATLLARIKGRDETEAALVIGANQALSLAEVADRPARGVDPARKRGLGDDAPAPDGAQDLVLAHDPVAVLHQQHEQVVDLGLDVDHLAPLAQLLAARVELVAAEVESHGSSLSMPPPATVKERRELGTKLRLVSRSSKGFLQAHCSQAS